MATLAATGGRARGAENGAWGAGAETRIQLLGRFRVWVRGAALADEAWPLRRARSLVKLLALAPQYRLHREQLMEQLWPDVPPRAATHNLRVALHAALQALGTGPVDPHRLLARVGDELVLGPASPTLTDVEAFEAAAVAACTADEPAAYHDALDLYPGDLLPEDGYDDAFVARRRHLRDTFHEVLDGLVRLYEADGDYDAALAAVQEVLARHPASRESEPLHVHLMRLHALAGRPDLAERRYASLGAMLRREYGVEPGDAAQALRRQIAGGRFGAPSPQPARPRGAEPDDIPARRVPPFFAGVERWGRYGKRAGEFDRPCAVAAGEDGTVYVADSHNDRIQAFDRDGELVRTWGTKGGRPGELHYPVGIAVAPDGTVYVVEYYNHRIQRFAPDGTLLAAWGGFGSGPGQLDFPWGVAVDPQGNVHVTEAVGSRVQTFTADGAPLRVWGTRGTAPGQLDNPIGVAVGRGGCVYVVDGRNHRVQQFSAGGELVGAWGRYGTGNGEFRAAHGIAVDPAGDLYVSDLYNMRIQKFAADGRFLCKWGRFGHEPGEFGGPRGLAVDAGGSLYVADAGNSWIERYVAGPALAMRALAACEEPSR